MNNCNSSLFQAVHGHNKPITALTLSTDKQWLYTADFEGHLTRWNVQNGESKRIQPQIHKSQVGYFCCYFEYHLFLPEFIIILTHLKANNMMNFIANYSFQS